MRFKEIRELIFCDIKLVIHDKVVENFYNYDDYYDEYEVIGIRADVKPVQVKDALCHTFNARVIISLKETLSTSENLGQIWHETTNLHNVSVCKEK